MVEVDILGMTTLAVNKRAKFDYEILETLEAGLVLKGLEVKSVKTGHVSLRGSYITIKDEEAYLINATIPPYQPKNTPDGYDPMRSRKLLLHKKELKYLLGKGKMKGLTLVPIRVYTKKGKIKLEFAVARGRKRIDKREVIKERETKRGIERAVKGDERLR